MTPGTSETLPALLAPATTALLIVDLQNDFVDERGRVAREGTDVRPLRAAVGAVNRLVDAARESGARVVYIRTEHGPDVDSAPYQARYARRGMTPDDTLCRRGTWGAQLVADLRVPGPGEPVIIKHGYDAFAPPALPALLQARAIRTVVVSGVVTNLCVRATAFSAFERGLFAVVPRQATAAVDPEVATQALADIAAWYGEVPALEEVLASWQEAAVR